MSRVREASKSPPSPFAIFRISSYVTCNSNCSELVRLVIMKKNILLKPTFEAPSLPVVHIVMPSRGFLSLTPKISWVSCSICLCASASSGSSSISWRRIGAHPSPSLPAAPFLGFARCSSVGAGRSWQHHINSLVSFAIQPSIKSNSQFANHDPRLPLH